MFVLYIHVEIGKKQTNFTLIPMSLFRDYSLIREFCCDEYS